MYSYFIRLHFGSLSSKLDKITEVSEMHSRQIWFFNVKILTKLASNHGISRMQMPNEQLNSENRQCNEAFTNFILLCVLVKNLNLRTAQNLSNFLDLQLHFSPRVWSDFNLIMHKQSESNRLGLIWGRSPRWQITKADNQSLEWRTLGFLTLTTNFSRILSTF